MYYFCGVKIHEIYIKRCIELAKNGLGNTYPNPMVGSVIVHNDKIIGEGWHKKSGESHAEVLAIESVKDKSLLSKATIYVSLEPCSHFGKTPPCADLIIKHKIPNIVIGTLDPNEKVAGNGIKKLLENGRNVTVGVLEEECYELNKRFFSYHIKKRPYIILKWAESKDGYISPENNETKKPIWISNEHSRQLVHKWRGEEQAILVGTNTVLIDNPKLNTRDWKGNNPIRIVIDRNNVIPKESYIFDNEARTIIISEKETNTENTNVTFEFIDFKKDTTRQIIDILYKNKIQSIIIEGGSATLQRFIDDNYWDEARVFIGKNNINKGTKAPVLDYKSTEKKAILDDILIQYRNNGKRNNI